MALIKVVMAQVNPLVGDIEGNVQLITRYVLSAQETYQADVVVFPELTLCGYPPEDLLLRHSMQARIDVALQTLAQQPFTATVVVGYPKAEGQNRYNMAGVLQNKQWITEYANRYYQIIRSLMKSVTL